MKKVVWIFALILSYAMVVRMNLHYKNLKIPYSYEAWVVKIPTKNLKDFALGYQNLLADLTYIWAIQYFATPEIPEEVRRKNLRKFFEAIWSLDPRYLETYSIAALIADIDFHDPDTAIEFLLEGFKRNPRAVELLEEAAFYAFSRKKDYDLAHKLYMEAYRINKDPKTLRLAAAMLEKKQDVSLAWNYWMQVYKKADSEYLKKIAWLHLYKIKAKMDLNLLKNRIQEFRKKFGRNPMSLEELVSTGLLKEVPRDLDGHPYQYDPATGEVKPAKEKLWK